ncbi:hypothetical protein MJN85_30385, partial [Salmonella enterica subsp. enterica serovar Anatum]|nr:hypothetical protein [Salmonella enterica subsp. enterica serovar Anatum]
GRALVSNPRVLLLDEPTNHLDIETIDWLEGFLKTFNGTIIFMVSIFFSSFLLTAAPKRRVRFGNERRNPENRGMARCSGCASLC